METIVTDFTFVCVRKRWIFVCFMIDFFNYKIIYMSVGWYNKAFLVKKVIQSIPYVLTRVKMFNFNSGNGFDNQMIVEIS